MLINGASCPQVDYRRKWHVLVAVGSGVFLATLNSSIINLSLPTLVRALQTEFYMVQWVVLVYLLTVTATLLGFGRVGDIFGKKRVYLIGYLLFTFGSALCGLATSIHGLIGFRVIQAVGGAMIVALGAAILTEAFPPAERGRAMGLIGAVVSVGIAIGPALGGLIIGSLSWRWIFYVNLPVGLLGTVMVVRNIPDLKPSGRQSFDFWGALTLFASLAAFLSALSFGQRQGFSAIPVLGLLALSFMLMVLFLLLERHIRAPMIDLQMFRNGLFSISLATGFICFVALAGVLILIPFYLQDILGYETVHVGLLMGIVPVMLGLSSPFSGAWSDRVGSRPIMVVGLSVLLLGFLAATSLSEYTTAVGYMVRMFALGLGMGIFLSPNSSAIMGTAPRSRMGVVSGFMSITRTLGQTVGVSLMGAIWVARTAYHAASENKGLVPEVVSVHAQVLALNDTFKVSSLLVCTALFLGIWAMLRNMRRKHDAAVSPAQSDPHPGPRM